MSSYCLVQFALQASKLHMYKHNTIATEEDHGTSKVAESVQKQRAGLSHCKSISVLIVLIINITRQSDRVLHHQGCRVVATQTKCKCHNISASHCTLC